jgi:hypothetical protein
LDRETEHNLALLDALAALKKEKDSMFINLNNFMRAILIKLGGSIEIEAEFLESYDDQNLIVDYEFNQEDMGLKIFIREFEDEQ